MKYKRLSAQKHRQIIRCFCADITATACSEILDVNRNTVNSWYNEFRYKIFVATISETRAEGGDSRWTNATLGFRGGESLQAIRRRSAFSNVAARFVVSMFNDYSGKA